MTYVKVIDDAVGKYPYDVRQLRRDNPNTSFPNRVSDEMMADWDVFPVTEKDMTDYDERIKNCVKNSQPAFEGGNWTVSWTVSDKTAEETSQYNDNLSVKMRVERNTRLAETDFHALSDVTMGDAMKGYRQRLRDITEHSNWPNLKDTDWPTIPS